MNFILRNIQIVNIVASDRSVSSFPSGRDSCLLSGLGRRLRVTLLHNRSSDADVCLSSEYREWTNLYNYRHEHIISRL